MGVCIIFCGEREEGCCGLKSQATTSIVSTGGHQEDQLPDVTPLLCSSPGRREQKLAFGWASPQKMTGIRIAGLFWQGDGSNGIISQRLSQP